VGQVLPVSSFLDYEQKFGGLDARSPLGYAVRHFHDNGGAQARVLRIAGAAIAPNDTAFLHALDAAFAAGGPIDRIDAFNLICVPGLTEAAATAMLQEQAVAHRAFLIVDCDERALAASVAASLAGITGANAANSALYFPWVMASDPLQGGALRAFPPGGFVAGLLARIDAARGVWKAPAGSEAHLIGATDLAVHLSDTQNESLNGQGINCLRQFPGRGVVVWGARTLAAGITSPASEWKYIPVRRPRCFSKRASTAGPNGRCSNPMPSRCGAGCARASAGSCTACSSWVRLPAIRPTRPSSSNATGTRQRKTMSTAA
jgi:uncharacterized protein